MTPELINIIRVTFVDGYRLLLDFDDSTSQTIDFEPFLSRSQHPSIRSFLTPKTFSAYRLEHGELVWGDYELCFPMADLYRNAIDQSNALSIAA